MTHMQKINPFMLGRFITLTTLAITLASCGGQESAKQDSTPSADTAMPAAREAPAAAAPASTPFTKEVAYDNIKFQVNSPGTAMENSFTVTPSGLSISNEPITEKIQGLVVDVQTDDMDGDNAPELAVIVEDSPAGKRRAYVFSANARKSFGPVNFADVTDVSKLSGYEGGDEFAFVENTFIRRFPLYEGGQKTGKTRQFQFKLKAGEAMKQLVFDRQTEF